jgi:transcriptional regulator with XRE-family HTH domain
MATARIRQTDAARRLGISQPALSRRLSGGAPWRDGEVEKLAAICGIPLTDLMAVA